MPLPKELNPSFGLKTSVTRGSKFVPVPDTSESSHSLARSLPTKRDGNAMTNHGTKYILSSERYEGHIAIDKTSIPFAATISADFAGRLRLAIEPLSFGASSDLGVLMRTSGRPDT